MSQEKFSIALVIAIALVLSIAVVSAVEPFGASVNKETSSRAQEDTAGNDSAIAGNVTELTVFGYTITQSWQGYFGNVSGTIMLADSSDNIMYNWSVSSPEGEIYASTNNSVQWAYVQCFNFTAAGTYADDKPQNGSTSLFGTNMTLLESEFGIAFDDKDGVNETFSLSGAGTHDLFYANNLLFTEGECQNTRIFNSSGQGYNNIFEEVLLYEPETRSVLFTTILDEESPVGFDGNLHDFEMLVLEDGHGVDVSTTPYYFWVELE